MCLIVISVHVCMYSTFPVFLCQCFWLHEQTQEELIDSRNFLLQQVFSTTLMKNLPHNLCFIHRGQAVLPPRTQISNLAQGEHIDIFHYPYASVCVCLQQRGGGGLEVQVLKEEKDKKYPTHKGDVE